MHAARQRRLRGGRGNQQPQQAAAGARDQRRAGGVRQPLQRHLLAAQPEQGGPPAVLQRQQRGEVIRGERRGGRLCGGSDVVFHRGQRQLDSVSGEDGKTHIRTQKWKVQIISCSK